MIEDRYQLLPANERGHYPISPLNVELGIWQGHYKYATLPWLRWWDNQGNLLLTGEERAEQERQRAEEALAQLEQEQQRYQSLLEKLRVQDIDPEQLQ